MVDVFVNCWYISSLDNHPDDMKWSLSDGYLMVYKSLLLLGSNIRTDTLSKRISFLSVMIGGMLLYWLWEAQLISYFSFPSKQLPFNNLEEFLTKSDKKVFCNNTMIYLYLIILLHNSFHQIKYISANHSERIHASRYFSILKRSYSSKSLERKN